MSVEYLIKAVDKKEYAKKLVKGIIRFSPIGCYRNTGNIREDISEGNIFILSNGIKEDIDSLAFISCYFQVPSIRHNIKIEDFLSRIKKFGKYFVVIEKEKFIHKCSILRFRTTCSPIYGSYGLYSEKITYEDNKNTTSESIFIKNNDYKVENEFRIAYIPQNVEEQAQKNIDIKIGNISNFSKIYTSNEIDGIIINLYQGNS